MIIIPNIIYCGFIIIPNIQYYMGHYPQYPQYWWWFQHGEDHSECENQASARRQQLDRDLAHIRLET